MISGYVPTFGDGWWAFREALVDGVMATVESIWFRNTDKTWFAAILLDKEWSVAEWGSELRRYPREGDKRGTFSFRLSHLRPVKVPAEAVR